MHTDTTELLPELLQAVIEAMPVAAVLVGPGAEPLVWSRGCDLLRRQLLTQATDKPKLTAVATADAIWLQQLIENPQPSGVL